MSVSDFWGLVWSYAYAFALLLIIEGMGRRLHWPAFVTRKLVHIGAGMWVWGILYFFDHWYWGIVPFATFIVLNYIFYRLETFKSVDGDKQSPGTVYFAFSITLLFLLFWRTGTGSDMAPVAVAAVMAMTWGDAMASLIGRSIGRRYFTVFKHRRTLEGSAAMALVTLLAVWISLYFLSASGLSPQSLPLHAGKALWLALAVTPAATFAEAVSPAGTDNLSVPLVSATVLWLLLTL